MYCINNRFPVIIYDRFTHMDFILKHFNAFKPTKLISSKLHIENLTLPPQNLTLVASGQIISKVSIHIDNSSLFALFFNFLLVSKIYQIHPSIKLQIIYCFHCGTKQLFNFKSCSTEAFRVPFLYANSQLM